LLATEKVDGNNGAHWFLEATPTVTFDEIGGLDEQIEKLQSAFVIRFEHPEVAERYGLDQSGSALLKGPPGTGKTMLAKALANWLASLSPDGEARFISIKPGEFGSVWYSQTEANIREVFRVAREFGERNPRIPVVIFLDEIDSIGAPRGESFHRIDDRVQLALAAELDGLDGRRNVFVVAATNRAEDLDAAFLRNGRLGDAPIEVPRPNRDAAAAILAKYLVEELPYADGRDELIDAAVARLYSANGDGDVARITFRDGTARVVRGADLVSGAALAKIAHDARTRACLREVRTGERGVRLEDLLESIADELEAQGSLLTPRSCHRFVGNLPQDNQVVRVERLRTESATRRHRYLTLHRPEAREEAA
jgi:proteasome-associated ATPase